MAINQLDDAERNLEFFLAGYPEHPDYPEAYYQKGRLLFRQGELESGIQLLQSFINRYPDSPFLPNAYFWIGESLYLLGQLEEAAAVCNKIQLEYPKSFKVEAARYRLSLIEFKKREIELLKLLKWSHEESLKTVEEFQRREKSYEQAIAAYQRRLSYLKQGVDWEKDDELILDIEQLKSENAALKDQNEKLQAQVAALKDQIEKLQAQVAALKDQNEKLQAQVAASAAERPKPVAAGPQIQEYEKKLNLLRIMEEALALKESLLQWIERENR
ncbi:Cell division coordinator CpoB [subsurface metagenome]